MFMLIVFAMCNDLWVYVFLHLIEIEVLLLLEVNAVYVFVVVLLLTATKGVDPWHGHAHMTLIVRYHHWNLLTPLVVRSLLVLLYFVDGLDRIDVLHIRDQRSGCVHVLGVQVVFVDIAGVAC